MALVCVESQGDVAVIRLENGVTNALSPAVLEELTATMGQVKNDCAGLVIAGGDKFFSNGFDLPLVLKLDRAAMADFIHRFNALLFDLFTLPLPTASAARGHAVGAGAIMFLACDYRFAREGRTLIGMHGIKLGIPMPYLVDMILRQVLGDGFASDMLYRGALVEAAAAEAKGMVHAVFPADQVEAKAVERVAELARLVQPAFRATKSYRVETVRTRYEANGRARNQEFLDIWFSPATQALLQEAAAKF